VDDDVIYFMAEMKQETNYVVHHVQKVVAFFLSMRNFKDSLIEQGHEVIYYTLDDSDNKQDLIENIKKICEEQEAEKFEYQMPDEYRLDEQLKTYCDQTALETEAFDSEHFLTTRDELAEFYKDKKQFTMEYFYRHMRKKHDIMIVGKNDPEGGKWNFDKSNRKKWKGDFSIPEPKTHPKEVTKLVQLLQDMKVKTIGSIKEDAFEWPTSRKESLEVLEYFCEHLLVHFGDFQDAMDPQEIFLFHSRLSFALNSKMISPLEVITKVIEHWRTNKDEIDISQVEGFVRQILGWREYMRGMYWQQMPDYRDLNVLENSNPLPNFYWSGNTKMNCLKHAIGQSLDKAYAHHIQRLMVTGNFALLTQCDPDEVDAWYLGIYIDAIEWVEITNTRGMSQWADGGLIATKPYVSSGSYINKMSNYCGGCSYKVSKKTGDDACPFNSLYWNFLSEKRSHFEDNRRMNMMLSMLDKMDDKTLAAHQDRARDIIKNPDNY
ncbi:MAG: cryptochrome/photolyase family protein, partial [Flavobacteriaceae bacterium]|nr:cryptochrome/photolyase family protein [Flavobacteriaceae bacterium]